MSRRRRTDGELQQASAHVLYGLAQLVGTAELLSTGRVSDDITHNALIESFVAHVRATIDFFNSKPRFDDDIVAGDFFDDGHTWLNAMPAWLPQLDGVKARADKELAHLTYTRNGKTVSDKRWEWTAISKAIEPMVRAFARLVNPHRLSADWNAIANS